MKPNLEEFVKDIIGRVCEDWQWLSIEPDDVNDLGLKHNIFIEVWCPKESRTEDTEELYETCDEYDTDILMFPYFELPIKVVDDE